MEIKTESNDISIEIDKEINKEIEQMMIRIKKKSRWFFCFSRISEGTLRISLKTGAIIGLTVFAKHINKRAKDRNDLLKKKIKKIKKNKVQKSFAKIVNV